MKVIKDTTFQFGYVRWQVRPPRPSVTLVVKGTFDLVPDAPCTLSEEQAPVTGEQHWDDDPAQSVRLDSDLAILKLSGECLLAGTCHPPSPPATVAAVSFRVGPVTKRLAVIGDRRWSNGFASAPLPFRELPLRYERSFGGEGFAANPVGRGLAELLPNIEDPERLIASPSTRPEPAGAFPIPRTWKSRAKKVGRTDQRWLETRWPYFPEDFDASYFNAAPEDQRIDGFFRGDEPIELVHLRHEHPRLTTRLPGVRARCFLVTEKDPFREVPLKLDTISVDADAGKVFCLWRGLVEVEREKLDDIRQVFVLHEPLDATVDDARARYDAKLAELEAAQEAFAPEAPPDPEADEDLAPPAVDASGLRARVEETLQSGGSLAGEDLTGADLSGLSFASVELTGALLAEASLANANFEGAKLDGAVLSAAKLDGARFDRASLVGADLSEASGAGASFAGASMKGAILNRCRLLGASFQAAELSKLQASEAVLAQADFSGATLDQADLSRATLSSARLGKASLVDAKLEGADASGANLDEANVEKLRATGARLTGASLKKVKGKASRWEGANLDGANFTGSVLDRADFSGATLRQALLGGCSLVKARFLEARLSQASLLQSNLHESDLQSADLTLADLRGANLFGSELWRSRTEGARFELANLDRTKLAGR